MKTFGFISLMLFVSLTLVPTLAAQLPSGSALPLADSTSVREDAGGGAMVVGGPSSTATTTYTAGQGVSSVIVIYTNLTTGGLTSNSHVLSGRSTGSFSDSLPDTKAGDQVRVTCIYELANGKAASTDKTVTVKPPS